MLILKKTKITFASYTIQNKKIFKTNNLNSTMEKTLEEIEFEVIDLISDKLSIDKSKIASSSHLINDLGADSLDRVELTMELEDKYTLKLEGQDYANLTTVREIATYISKNTQRPTTP